MNKISVEEKGWGRLLAEHVLHTSGTTTTAKRGNTIDKGRQLKVPLTKTTMKISKITTMEVTSDNDEFTRDVQLS